jgi:predicted transcriptional regulator
MPPPSIATPLKQKVHELADRLPENATWRDVAYQAAVRAEAEEGRADIAAGRLVDGDEMLRWIDSWGTGHELEAPKLPSQ